MSQEELIEQGKRFLYINKIDINSQRDCLETSIAFIKWMDPFCKIPTRFKLLVGIDKNTTEINVYPFVKYHAVILHLDSDLVLDLTYNQFDKNIPILVYSKKEYLQKYDVNKFKELFYENNS